MALLVETCMGPHICQNAPPLGKVLVVPVTGELSRAESPAGLGAGHLDRPHEGRARAHCVRQPPSQVRGTERPPRNEPICCIYKCNTAAYTYVV